MSQLVSLQSMPNTAALLLGASIIDLFPGVQLVDYSATPACFFYDVILPFEWNPEFLAMIQERMIKMSKESLPIQVSEMMQSNASGYLSHLGQKMRAQKVLTSQDSLVSIIKIGDFADFASPDQLEDSSCTTPFRLVEVFSVGKALRIVGVLAETKDLLKQVVKSYESLEKEDHVSLGQRYFRTLDGPNDWVFLPEGTALKHKIQEEWQQIIKKHGFLTVDTCQAKGFSIEQKHKKMHSEFGLNKIAEWERGEQKFPSDGLLNSSIFYLDRMHVFCTSDQIKDAVTLYLQMIGEMLSIFSLDYTCSVCVVGLKQSKALSSLLQKSLQDLQMPFAVQTTPTQYRGPAIEMRVTDSYGRSWPVSCVWIYENGSGKYTVSGSLFCSLERFIALLLEKTKGSLNFMRRTK